MRGSTGSVCWINCSRNRYRSFKLPKCQNRQFCVDTQRDARASGACARTCLLRGSSVAASFRVFIVHCLPPSAHASHPCNYPCSVCLEWSLCLSFRSLTKLVSVSFLLAAVRVCVPCVSLWLLGPLLMGWSKRWASRQGWVVIGETA